MRHSLLLRLLGLSLAVAAVAIATTAWLTTRDAGERFRGEFERTLEADTFIYQQLTAFAGQNNSWDDVAPLVEELAERTGRRVALTGADGAVLADSAALSGQAAPLPSNPTAEIDARSSPANIVETTYVSGEGDVVAGAGVDDESHLVAEEALASDVTLASSAYGEVSPLWRMTDDEARQRSALAQEAQDCLRETLDDDALVVTPAGEVLWVGESAFDLSQPPHDLEGSTADTPYERVDGPMPTLPDCFPAELLEPSSAAAKFNQRQVELQEECLGSLDLPFALVDTGHGLQRLLPSGVTQLASEATDPSDPPSDVAETDIGADETIIGDDSAALEAWAWCEESAWRDAMADFVAEPAVLYTGTAERFDPFFGDGWWRTILAGTGVLIVATGVTVLAGRRLTSPVRALTAAAGRMGSGDHGARVKVRGRDDVAQLGQAFNTMAESIAVNDAQRRAMVSDVAHELRTPLSNVRGYLEAAEDGVVPLDQELVTSLLEESSLLHRLIDDLQDLALADAGKLRIHPEKRDARDLARQAVTAHRAGADDADIALVLDCGDAASPTTVRVDPARLRQALGNLVANAVRFAPEGGAVTVSVRADDSSVLLAVSDDGPGIPAEHLPRLFDRFYRVEGSRSRETGGSGLGLAISKHLVEAHGGRLDVSSVEGEGSVFTIRLPAAESVPPD